MYQLPPLLFLPAGHEPRPRADQVPAGLPAGGPRLRLPRHLRLKDPGAVAAVRVRERRTHHRRGELVGSSIIPDKKST